WHWGHRRASRRHAVRPRKPMNPISMFPVMLAALLAIPASAQDLVRATGDASASGPTFVANRGQWDSRVAFQLQSGPATAWFHDRGVVIDRVKREAEPIDDVGQREGAVGPRESRVVGHETVRLSFAGGNAGTPIGREPLRGTMSFLYGSD